MTKIHIAVACHKPSRLPNNSLLVPVQVNSAKATKKLDMRHDDEGENISIKNAQYCELTAQYWEWKNVDADYYGLCHYRRFLCFNVPEKVKRNNRGHIEAEAIDDINIQRFGLEDEAQMRQIIEDNDVIVGEYEEIPKLFTPRGNQLTTYKHWTAHDRALIMVKDLEKMLEILNEVSPEIGKDAREYLNKDVFTGFNCFVMKKNLFNEMCEIEFEVLKRLEKEVDLSLYCTQLSRIYGFMGEIISSSYIYHIEKNHQYKVKHVPLLYFNNTDEQSELKPIKENAIPVLFYQNYEYPQLFSVELESFLEHTSADNFYDLIIATYNMNNSIKAALLERVKDYTNISMRFLDIENIEKGVSEHYFNTELLERKYLDAKGHFDFILPYVLLSFSNYPELIVITDHTLVLDSLDNLWKTSIPDDKLIAATKDALMQARVNDIYPETEQYYLQKQLKNPYDYYGMYAFKLRAEKYYQEFNPERITGVLLNTNGDVRSSAEILNVLCEGRMQSIGHEYCVWYESNPYLKYQLPYAPADSYQELLTARKKPTIAVYQGVDPFSLDSNEITMHYWKYARISMFHDWIVGYGSTIINHQEKPHIDITEKLFPKGSAIHGTMSRLFPKNTRRFKVIKGILAKFNME